MPRLLVTELWGLGDLALAVPFLRTASAHAKVTLLAKPHAAPLLARFALGVALVPFVAPWTAFRGKYRLHAWPWRALARTVRTLRAKRFATAVSARADPRDHALMFAAGATRRMGFPRAGSQVLLNAPLPRPASPHRFACWQALASALGWTIPPAAPAPRNGRRIVCHTGAAQPARQWGRERFEAISRRLHDAGWQVTLLDERSGNLEALIDTLATADRFVGNDSGPGHLAALLGVPTFTVFGSQLPEVFSPVHPQAAGIESAPCPYKPCNDYCRFAEPNCIRSLTVDDVWSRLASWLA